jgi:hypothetical protein
MPGRGDNGTTHGHLMNWTSETVFHGRPWSTGRPLSLTGPQPSFRMVRCSMQPSGSHVCKGIWQIISPANVVGKAHWYSDKLTVRGMVPWRQTMVRMSAGAQCEWCWARATTLIKTPAKRNHGRGGPEPWSGCTYPPFLNPPPVHWW